MVTRILPPVGEVEIYYGPMFAQKSASLLADILHRNQYGRQRHQLFHPIANTRDDGLCRSRNGTELPSTAFGSVEELWDLVDPTTNLVAIDEVQFAEPSIVALIVRLRDRGHDVVCSGLDFNFRGEPFPAVSGIINLADERHRQHAWCTECGRKARWSQLLTAPPQGGSDIVVGNDYAARCERCFKP